MAQPILSKSLSLMEDQMKQEALAVKKCNLYSTYFTDANLKTLSSELAQHHKQRFDELYDYLNSH